MKHIKTFENFNNFETTNEIFGLSKKEKWNKLSPSPEVSPRDTDVDEWFLKLFSPEKKHVLGVGGNIRVFDKIISELSKQEKIKFIEEAIENPGKDYIVVYGRNGKVELRELNYKSQFSPHTT